VKREEGIGGRKREWKAHLRWCVCGGRGGGWVSEGLGVYCLVQLGMRVLGSDV
jgi:hypothetical protein